MSLNNCCPESDSIIKCEKETLKFLSNQGIGERFMKLSKTQKETLEKMEEGKWYTAYDLQVSLNTLYALYNRDLVDLKKDLMWTFFPRTSLNFRKRDKVA